MLSLGMGMSLTAVRSHGQIARAIAAIVIEGDSNTSGSPDTPNGFYSYQYQAHRPDKTINVRAQGSRVCAVGQTLNDGSNSLIGHFAEDMAYLQPGDLYTLLIGTNDMFLAQTTDQFMVDLWAQCDRVRAAGMRVGVSLIAPVTTNYAGDVTAWNERMAAANVRIRSEWASHADMLIPIGEHPDFNDATAGTTYISGDGVHWTTAGHSLAYDVYRAAVDSVLDISRAGATSPTPGSWLGPDLTSAEVSGSTTVRYIVEGLGIGKTATASISGAGATFRRGFAAFGTSSFTVVNGDVIEVTLQHSASYLTATSATLTIGSVSDTLTITTAANVTPVALTHVGILADTNAGNSTTFAAVDFSVTGIAVIVTHEANVSGLTVDGVAPTLLQTNGGMKLWTIPVTVAGTKDIVVTKSAWGVARAVAVSIIQNANETPLAYGVSNPGNEGDPHLTDTYTLPANGLALCFFGAYGGASAAVTCNTGTTYVADGGGVYQSEFYGIGLGSVTAAGIGKVGSFNFGGAYGSYPRGYIVFGTA